MNDYFDKWVEESSYMTIWHSGMFGLVVGDALGVPVQFMSESDIKNSHEGPVTGMRGGGVYHKPAGSWSDDSSMALATMESILDKTGIDLDDIMTKFHLWLDYGCYTPDDETFDQGITCTQAIKAYQKNKNPLTCGATGEYANGNGALMRILPVCLFLLDSNKRPRLPDDEAIALVHSVAALTHNTLRSNMCCGFYYFMVKAILDGKNRRLQDVLQEGITNASEFYTRDKSDLREKNYLRRILQLDVFKDLPRNSIKSSGYVIDTIEAAVWCLLNTDSYRECVLKAVNLGDDTDTVAAVAGGLAGLFYGYEGIPGDWLDALRRKNYITTACIKIGDAKFRFGTDPQPYRDLVLKLLQQKYDFVTPTLLNSKWRLDIQLVDPNADNDSKVFAVTNIYGNGQVYTYVKNDINTTYEMIRQSVLDLDRTILESSEVVDRYDVPFNPVQDSHGYNLERYEVSRLASGDFKIYIQEGDRVTGGGYSTFLSKKLIQGRTYSEVLDCMPLAGQKKEDLLKDGQLKCFLGVTDQADGKIPALTIVSLPAFTVIGESVFCCGSVELPVKKNIFGDETDVIDELWNKIRNKVVDYASLGKQSDDGSLTYWGIMSHNNPEYHDLSPWWHFGRTGYYFAGLEVAPENSGSSESDQQMQLPNCRKAGEWRLCRMPASSCVVVEVTPENYNDVYEKYYHEYIPASGYMISGAIMDCINSKTGEIKLYFSVRKLNH